jgi:hypothetical protein
MFWILRTGAPWRDLPPDFGGWEKLLDVLIEDPDYEWLMIDAGYSTQKKQKNTQRVRQGY